MCSRIQPLTPELAVILGTGLKRIVYRHAGGHSRCYSEPKEPPSSEIGDYSTYLDSFSSVKCIKGDRGWEVELFLVNTSLLPLSQFLYRRGMETCDALLILVH